MSTIIILVISALIVLILVGIYNGLVRARNRVEQADSDITVQLKRRYDLIPGLIKSVKGYMKHEKETLDAVVKARSQALKAMTGTASQSRQTENVLEGALKSLFALAENYPDLKANQNFLQLQEELVDAEDKIMAARRFYNSSLRAFIDKVQLFPNNLVAGAFGFDANQFEYFEVADSEAVDQAPEVDFSTGS